MIPPALQVDSVDGFWSDSFVAWDWQGSGKLCYESWIPEVPSIFWTSDHQQEQGAQEVSIAGERQLFTGVPFVPGPRPEASS